MEKPSLSRCDVERSYVHRNDSVDHVCLNRDDGQGKMKHAPGYGPTEAPACGCDTPGWQACRRTRDTVCICTCHANSAPQQASASADFGPMWVLKEQAEATIATRDAEIARLRALLDAQGQVLAAAHSDVAKIPPKTQPAPYPFITEWDLLPDV